MATKASDIRTNYALVSLMETQVGNTKTGNVMGLAECDVHRDNIVTVFCKTCGTFICKECFEVNSAAHACHNRVSLEDGVGIVSSDLESIKRRIQGELFTTAVEIQTETERVAESSRILSGMKQHATDHFNTNMLRFRSEFQQVVAQLSSYESFIQRKLNQSMTKKRALVEVLEGFPNSADLPSLKQFSLRKKRVHALLANLSESRSPSDALDGFSINQVPKESPIRLSTLSPLPVLRMLSPREGKLFDLNIPFVPGSGESASNGSTTTLHRSTSNDQLRS